MSYQRKKTMQTKVYVAKVPRQHHKGKTKAFVLEYSDNPGMVVVPAVAVALGGKGGAAAAGKAVTTALGKAGATISKALPLKDGTAPKVAPKVVQIASKGKK
jgi:hypothetical protein